MKRFLALISLLLLFALCLASCDEAAVSVVGAAFNEVGELILTMSDGTTQNVGKVPVEGGETAEEPAGFDFYPLSDGTYGVDLIKSAYMEEVVVPSTYRGKSVTSLIGVGDVSNLYDNAKIKKITIPNTVVIIGEDALAFPLLETVAFEEGSQLKTIGNAAFYGCKELSNITLPDSITDIACDAFGGCEALPLTEYDNARYFGTASNPYMILMEAKNTEITSCTVHADTRVITDRAFNSCASLNTVTFAQNAKVVEIGDYVFNGCNNLQSFTVPASVVEFGNMLFGYRGPDALMFEITDGWWMGTYSGEKIADAPLTNDPAANAALYKGTTSGSTNYSWYWYRT